MVLFAFALSIGNLRYDTAKESSILVTIGDELNIMIPGSATQSSTYIDVPLKNIASLAFDSQANSQSQTPFHALIIDLQVDIESGISCYVDAAGSCNNAISLAFMVEKDARMLKGLIEPTARCKAVLPQAPTATNSGGIMTMSQGVDVSQRSSDDQLGIHVSKQMLSSHRGLATASSTNNGGKGDRVASGLETSNSRRTVLTAGPSNSLVPAALSRRASFSNRLGPASSQNPQNTERVVSTSQGLDVSELERSHVTRNTDQLVLPNVRRNTIDQAPKKMRRSYSALSDGSEQNSQSGRRSPARRQSEIEVPEKFLELGSNGGDSSTHEQAQTQFNKDQDNDIDSAYDASPKVIKNLVLIDELAATLQQEENPQGKEKSKAIRDNDLNVEDAIRERSPSTKPPAASIAPEARMQLQALSKQIPDLEILNTANGAKQSAPKGKLSRRLQDTDGEIKSGPAPAVVGENSKGERQPSQVIAVPGKKTKALATSAIKFLAKSQPRSSKTNPKNKVLAAHADPILEADVDEYDVLRSPDPLRNTVSVEKPKEVLPARQSQARKRDVKTKKTQSKSKTPIVNNVPIAPAAPQTKLTSNDGAKYDPIWDEDLALREASQGSQSVRVVKPAKKRAVQTPKDKKRKQPPKKGSAKPKPESQAPVIPPRQRQSRRPAAIKANQKILGAEENDSISEVEETPIEALKPATQSQPKRKKGKVLQPISPSMNERDKDRETPASHYQSPTTAKDPAPLLEQQTVQNLTYGKTEGNGSPANVPFVKDSQALQITSPRSRGRSPYNPSRHTVAPVQDHSIGREEAVALEMNRTQSKVFVAEQAVVPETEPEVQDSIVILETNGLQTEKPEDYYTQEAMSIIGDADDRHFQEAMPDLTEGEGHLGESPPVIAEVPEIDGLNEKLNTNNNSKEVLTNHSAALRPKDPFMAKLHALVPKPPTNLDEPKPNDSIHVQRPLDVKSPVKAPEQGGNKQRRHEAIEPVLKEKDNVLAHKSKEKADGSNLHKAPEGRSPYQTNFDPNNVKQLKRDMTTKRKAEPEINKPRKRVRTPSLTSAHEQQDSSKVTNANELTNAKTPTVTLSRKPRIISWNTSGPRNQGTASTHHRNDKPPLAKGRFTQLESVSSKEEVAPYQDDPAPWEHARLGKPEREDDNTPSYKGKRVTQMIAQPAPWILDNKVPRQSSQSTRVDQNGSPLPFMHNSQHRAVPSTEKPRGDPIEIVSRGFIGDHEAMVFDDENDNDRRQEQLELSTARGSVLSPTRNSGGRNGVSNNKQVPSSPNAPSTFMENPAHYVLEDGRLMNGKSMESIVPRDPQDPFIGGEEKPPSSFMAALRKSSLNEDRRKIDEANNIRNNPDHTKRKSRMNEDDPDITLVNPQVKRRKTWFVSVSNSPSISEATSKEVPSSQEESEHKEDIDQAWWKALEPHQGDMADTLMVIMHVSLDPVCQAST